MTTTKKKRKIPEEEQDIREFLKRATSMVQEASNLGVRITLKWLFQKMKSHDALDQDQIYAIHEALTKVCKHDMHNHGGNVFRGGSICWTCGVVAVGVAALEQHGVFER